MRKLNVFNHVTLDGYFVDGNGNFGWARHGNDDPEYAAFVAENASAGGQLMFGRVTYQMMASYWPTPVADQHSREVAKGMNSMGKFVFSRTLDTVKWNNTTLLKGDIVTEVRRIKAEPGPGITILGSGSIVAQLARENLIDEYQMMVDPVALGKGRSMFDGIDEQISLKLAKSRTFNNGKLFLSYQATT
jgi:dihydrofolate reductase